MTERHNISVQPLTAARWPDVYQLFGDRGANAGCWCMWFRRPVPEYRRGQNGGNRVAFEGLVADERVPGLLAYIDAKPVGWVSVAPRDEFERISGDHEAAEHGVPEAPVWSIVCFYIHGRRRGTGIGTALVKAAVEHARAAGAQILEAYPVEPMGRTHNGLAYTGVRAMFEHAGFVEVGRFDRWADVPAASGDRPVTAFRKPPRPVMQLLLGSGVRGNSVGAPKST